jgi:YHS domain-containing protein
MQVEVVHAPAHTTVGGQRSGFASDRCRERFEAEPDRCIGGGAGEESHMIDDDELPASAVDPVWDMSVVPRTASAHRGLHKTNYWFCSVGCATAFEDDPVRFAQSDS